MNILNQHGKLYYYINTVMIFMAITLFTTTLSAADQPEKQPWTLKFELRLASDEYVEGWEKSPLPSGQSIWISPEVSISNADLLQAHPEETGYGFSVLFLLTEDGSLKFARFTKTNTGKFVAIMIDNRVVSAPKIMSEITGGRAFIEGNLTKKEARKIAEGIIGH
jgi:preprotein translocase subunit SecD